MFSQIKNIPYDINLNSQSVMVKNIFNYSYVIQSYIDNPLSTFDYVIREEDTPETLALRYYNDTKLSWTILLLNNIKDYYSEWPKTENSFSSYMKKKYLPENFGFIDLKRKIPLEKLSDLSIENVHGGQLIYTEDTDKTYVWNANTKNWDFFKNGIPNENSFNLKMWLSLDSYENPKHFLVSSETERTVTSNKTFNFVRGSTYRFNVKSQGRSSLYLTQDDGTNWVERDYFREYRNGVVNSRVRDGFMSFVVPEDAPNVLYYQSGEYQDLRGKINILYPTQTYRVENSDTNSLQERNGRIVGTIARANGEFYIWNGKYFDGEERDFTLGWKKLTTDTRLLSLEIAEFKPYEYVHREYGYKISDASYSNLSATEKRTFIMTSMLDYEKEQNEKNRKIKLLRPSLIPNFLDNWREVTI